jgi:RNA polymerase sigma factor (sigma-70 family)
MKDFELIKRIKEESCSESFLELRERHSGICFDTYSKYSKIMCDMGYEKNDIEADRDLILFKAANSFRLDKEVKFPTWLCNQMRYFCLNFINKNKNFQTSEDSVEQSSPSFLGSYQTEERAQKAMKKIKEMNDPRVYQVFKMRYFNRKPSEKKWKNIASKLGISNQTALNIHKRGLNFLKKNLTEIQ